MSEGDHGHGHGHGLVVANGTVVTPERGPFAADGQKGYRTRVDRPV